MKLLLAALLVLSFNYGYADDSDDASASDMSSVESSDSYTTPYNGIGTDEDSEEEDEPAPEVSFASDPE